MNSDGKLTYVGDFECRGRFYSDDNLVSSGVEGGFVGIAQLVIVVVHN